MRSSFVELTDRFFPVGALRILKGMAFSTLLALLVGVGVACSSVPTSIPADSTAVELIQKAQEALDKNNYRTAQFYYTATQKRFGSDPVVDCTCMYELAFIAYKQGRYEAARKGLNGLLEFYAKPGNESLPATYRILAQKVLAKLPPEKPQKPATK